MCNRCVRNNSRMSAFRTGVNCLIMLVSSVKILFTAESQVYPLMWLQIDWSHVIAVCCEPAKPMLCNLSCFLLDSICKPKGRRD